VLGLSTTLTRPSGLKRCSITRAWGTRSACDSALYGDIAGASQLSESSQGSAASETSSANGDRRAPPHSSQATAAATAPTLPIAFSASSGDSTNSSATIATLPAAAPTMSKL
jgi:hypothetical protein